jgi:esterase/lipase superfamily enzyme
LAESRKNNKRKEQKLLVTGCSMGAYHSANFFFRYPELFDTLVALSGVYSTRYFFGDYMDDAVYFHSPVNYLQNLLDTRYLDSYKKSKIIICCGQGAYEERMIDDTRRIGAVLAEKNIPVWIDFWGHDVNHDWCWWKKQIVYFLDNCFNC